MGSRTDFLKIHLSTVNTIAHGNWQILSCAKDFGGENSVYDVFPPEVLPVLSLALKKAPVIGTARFDEDVIKIPAVLDEQSELLGGSIKSAKTLKEVKRHLKRRYALIYDKRTLIVLARTIDEAKLMLMVLFKSASYAKTLKSPKAIGKFSSMLERTVYHKIYSVQNISRQSPPNVDAAKKADEKASNDVINYNSEYNDKCQMEYAGHAEEIIALLKRLDKSGLTLGTWGNVSLRLDNCLMLVTPKGLSAYTTKNCDIILYDYIKNKCLTPGTPSSELAIHRGIMKHSSDVNAVIHAHPEHASYFAVSREGGVKLNGKDVRCSRHALPSTSLLARNTLKALWGDDGVFMGGHGVTVKGASLAEAEKNLRALEAECRIRRGL